MKLFLGALLACFVGGLALHHAQRRVRTALLCALCMVVCIGYYFVHQI